MPLIKSKSPKAFKENIKKEIAAGKPTKQAVAIAYAVADKKKKTGEKISKSIRADKAKTTGEKISKSIRADKAKTKGKM